MTGQPDLTAATDAPVLLRREGAAGVITLNRPKALNALTFEMVRAIHPALVSWAADDAVTRIVVKGAGGKAFCAGGDIRLLHDLGKAGELDEPRAFWRAEYTLNHALKVFRKPIVALIDGIVMGGGVGMSFHGSHRVVSEKLMFAMPEVGIGFFPDVGSSWFLPRLPGRMGLYLALSGARIGRADAMMLGLGTHSVASADLPAIEDALVAGAPVDEVMACFAAECGPAPLSAHAATIAEAFSPLTLGGIFAALDRLAASGDAFAAETLAMMRAKSPTSMAIALEQMKRGASLSFADAMRMEYRIVCRIAEGHDFYEGVRAVIIDKDNAPRWRPASIADLDAGAIAAHFAPLADELVLE